MDRVSLSSWTGRAVIQACGCGHPWALERRNRAMDGLARATTIWTQLVQWLLVQMAPTVLVASMVQLVVLPLHTLPRPHLAAVPTASHFRTSHCLQHRLLPLPLVLPTRADLETVKRMMKGDTYIGRGCRQRGLTRSVFGNPYKLCDYGRSQAVAKYRQLLDDSPELSSQLINHLGRRLSATQTQSSPRSLRS